MSVAIVVPFTPGLALRDRNWAWLRARWQERHPEWPVVEGTCEGPWSKGVAVADALDRTDADVVVIADADLWCDGTAAAVDVVGDGAPWAMPHRMVYRLMPSATRHFLAGADPHRANGRRAGYVGVEGGGLVVLRRRTALEVPIDPRFIGWGGEDISWGWALHTLVGPPVRLDGDLWHLWHEPQVRPSRRRGSPENERLAGRYRDALHQPDVMRALIEEGRADGETHPRVHHPAEAHPGAAAALG